MHGMTEENGAATSEPIATPVAPAQPPATPAVTAPAVNPPQQHTGTGRAFDPELAENTLSFPGMAEYIDKKFGITELKTDWARKVCVTDIGISNEAAAQLTGSPEQIVNQAKILKAEIDRVKATLAPDAASATTAVTPSPGNPVQGGEMSASEFMRQIQAMAATQQTSAAPANPREAEVAEYLKSQSGANYSSK